MKKSLLCFFAFLTALATGCDKNDSPEQVAFNRYSLEIDPEEWSIVTEPGGALYGHEVYKIRTAGRFRQLFSASPAPAVDFQKEVLLLAIGKYNNGHPVIHTVTVYRNSAGGLTLRIEKEDLSTCRYNPGIWLVAVGIDDSLADEPVELQVEELGYTGD